MVATVCAVAMVAAGLTTGSPAGADDRVGGGGRFGDRTTIRVRMLGVTRPLRDVANEPARVVTSRQGSDAESLIARIRRGPGSVREDSGPPAVASQVPSTDHNLSVSFRKTGVIRSFPGSNSFDTAFSDNGNAFFVEPPDQGICVGRGLVMETVNVNVQIFSMDGKRLLKGQSGYPVPSRVGVSSNQFYGFPPALTATSETGAPFGPFLADPSCYYDPVTQRWFHVSLNLELDRDTGAFTGRNSLDIAVSRSSDPMGRWAIYRIPAENNGGRGTPDHRCDEGFCIGDYPHIAADEHGFYITTNEYAFFGAGYTGSQMYAIPKDALVAGDDGIEAVYWQNLRVPSLDQRGFTVRPAWSRPSSFVPGRGGTQYFVSSTAGDGSETGNPTGRSNKIVVWALTGTGSLTGDAPDLSLHQEVVTTIPYALPPLSRQKPGPTPFLRCLNLGTDCIFGEDLGHQDGPYPLDSSDTRALTSFFADGVLWTALTTGLTGSGGASYDPSDGSSEPIARRAGVAYFAFRPSWDGGNLNARVVQQDYLAVRGQNITFPSIGVNERNQGFVGVTLVGPGYNPGTAYARIGLGVDPAVLRVAGAGQGPSDGFTGTLFGGFRPRWQDYSYIVPGAGDTLWYAAERIGQRCQLEELLADFSCGLTRTIFTNWGTYIAQLKT